MGHRINVWIQRLLTPVFVIAALILLRFGFSGVNALAILLPIFCALMLLLIVLDPGPRAKAFLESLRNRSH
jgi:hypothetical protein